MPEIIAAILASVLFNISLVLQAVDARTSPASLSFRPGLLVHLLRQPAWILGSLLGLSAVALETYALTRLPLSFVQPVIAAGVLVLPPAARVVLGESPSLDSVAASAVIVGGVVLLANVLPLDSGRIPDPGEPALILPAVLAAAVYVALRGLNDARALCVIAGVAYGCTGIYTKLLALSTSPREAATALAALACFGAIGFLAEMSALQRLSPTRAAPVILGLTTVIPVVAGRALLGERWPNPALTLLALGLILLPAMWIVARVSLRQEDTLHSSGTPEAV